MNDSGETFESSHSSKKFNRLQMDCEENDDTQEKKELKRNSAIIELSLNSNKKNSTTFTAEQISNHYGDCMKLASENKITSKNAFDLHLIEYLHDYMHSLQNFQKVSSSLDAGAKIYAGRVDMVHSHTYNILTGCNISHEVSEGCESRSADKTDVDELNLENKIRRHKKRVDETKNMICSNIRKIRLSAAQIRTENDPLFQSQAKKYDEGGTGELRLNNVRVVDDSYGVLLDTDTFVTMNTLEYDDDRLSNAVFNISECLASFRELTLNHFPITSEFEGFKFSGWDPDNETVNSYSMESFKSAMYNNNLCTDADDDDMDIFEAGDVNAGDKDVVMYSKVDEDEDNMLTIGSSKHDESSSFFVSSVKEMVNSYMENYGEINDDLLGLWAGPDHWRQKAKGLKPFNNISDKPKILKVGKNYKEMPPIFPDWVNTRLDCHRIGRLVDIQFKDADSKTSSKSTQLTDDCLNKNIKKEYTLPPRNQLLFKSLNQLMNREISLVNKALQKHTQQMAAVVINDDQERCRENEGEISFKELIIIDDDGNISKQVDENGDNRSCSSDDDPYTGNSFRNCNFDDFCTQITDDNPGIGMANISYAKIAKRINVKKIKQEMMSYLMERIHLTDVNDIKNNVPSSINLSHDVCHLSDLLVNIDSSLPTDVSKELSVSILITCLLHVANETGLDITSDESLSDFQLRQGYSKYDLEQIALFAEDKDLRSESRKRRSKVKSSPGTSKIIRTSATFSDFDYEDDDDHDNDD